MNLVTSKAWLMLAGMLALSGCSTPKLVTSGAFHDMQRLEASLERGVSTREDVKRFLGEPNGRGEFLLGQIGKPRRIWYYEDIEVIDIASQRKNAASLVPGATTGLYLAMRQQILLVFFQDDRYDGMLWSSNAGDANAWVH
ncbi:hypothetical protein PTE30175_01102 [Pandoraea terrae]|uniref:Lipoprotein n=1 Tax=Pandoraea terrae TaxID=1537710 RepID=A0A5E4T0W3_9BURK|nr:hypothetical protein [Pandoraea terrae]VVD81786.1 hypothetical protein PTE30175_01102 [Pandoraea terrae]